MKITFIIFFLGISFTSFSQEMKLNDSTNKTIATYKVGDEIFLRYNVNKKIVLNSQIIDTVLQISAIGTIKRIDFDYLIVDDFSYANYILNGEHIFNNVSAYRDYSLLEIPSKIAFKDIGLIQRKLKKILVNDNMIFEKGEMTRATIKIM